MHIYPTGRRKETTAPFKELTALAVAVILLLVFSEFVIYLLFVFQLYSFPIELCVSLNPTEMARYRLLFTSQLFKFFNDFLNHFRVELLVQFSSCLK